ncbi:ThuA domain-containing protein [Herbiconiux moechotypicola]|uniref:ThuA-like domain-containing protein n=1 Tax=Herbiconiux moechotypicola TaxID=637393 RepID=A0ABN3DFI9_9MICO|nr:ThuA domain-containing protein [Herbiconiux moechotypicola]MCS5729396.1 ThuA domain-containing protein [Herbiconiux moechotypicola]
MSRILLFSGGGDYADPWHPFAETSALVAGTLRASHHDVTVVDTLDALQESLDDGDLLVVNAGGGPTAHPLDDRLATIVSGHRGPLLALHVAATLLPGHDEWEESLGGRWVRGVSMHPERGALRLRAVSDSAVVSGLEPLDTIDEAYSWLRVSPAAEVLLVHDYDDTEHPAAWTLDRDGRRAAYTSLGHDPAAYESPLAGALLRRLTAWLTADVPA